MKVCPDCKQSFDDDVGVCPNDDVELVDAPDALDKNPALREVVEVSPSERTSMIDLEAIEAKRKERDPPQEAAGDEKTPPPVEEEADPDATGTLDVDAFRKRKRSGKKVAPKTELAEEPVAEATGTKREGGRSRRGTAVGRAERTSRSRLGGGRPPATEHDAIEPEDRTIVAAADDEAEQAGGKGRRGVSPLLVGVLALFAVAAIGAGVYVLARASAPLTVTSVPPGATVRLDGKVVGLAPVQKRVAVGNHTIELDLDGFEPFKEVVEVASEGMAFLQPLRQKPPPGPPAPTPQQIADEIFAAAERLMAAGDLDGASAKINELVKTAPDDKRAVQLFVKLDAARKEVKDKAEKDKKAQGTRSASGKKAEARVAFQEGVRLYERDRLDEAKEKLLEAVRLDGTYADPHRTLARIFNRESATPKVRYHLGRFLALGGADPDFKVREWLKQNQAP